MCDKEVMRKSATSFSGWIRKSEVANPNLLGLPAENPEAAQKSGCPRGFSMAIS